MKRTVPICLGLMLLFLSGCMSTKVVRATRNQRDYEEMLKYSTSAQLSPASPPPDKQWASYWWLPVTIPADITTSPFQLLMYLYYMTFFPKC